MEDETRQCTEQVGSLSDVRISLLAEGASEPPPQLSQQGVATVYHNAVRMAALSHFPNVATEHWDRVQEAITELSRIPLRRGLEGANLKSLAEKTGSDDFLEGLVRHIMDVLCNDVPDLNECRIYLAAAERSCRTKDNVSHPLCRELGDLVLRRGHAGAYCLGARDDNTLHIVREHLRDILRSGSLRRQPNESFAMLIDRSYSLVFRDRLRVLDAKASINTRKYLIENAQSTLEAWTASSGRRCTGTEDHVFGINTILARLFSAGARGEAERNEAARPLPYLGSEHRSLRLDFGDCCLSRDTQEALANQASELKTYLCENFHTEEEISNATPGQTQDWSPSPSTSDGAEAVLTVFGRGDIYVTGNGGTLIDVKAKSELSVEDETHVLLCAALASASRAILWDTRLACFYLYTLTTGEGTRASASCRGGAAR